MTLPSPARDTTRSYYTDTVRAVLSCILSLAVLLAATGVPAFVGVQPAAAATCETSVCLACLAGIGGCPCCETPDDAEDEGLVWRVPPCGTQSPDWLVSPVPMPRLAAAETRVPVDAARCVRAGGLDSTMPGGWPLGLEPPPPRA